MGLRKSVTKSTFADANEHHELRIWTDVAAVLIRQAHKIYSNDDIVHDRENTTYAFDSSTIDLCLSLLLWADYSSTKAVVKTAHYSRLTRLDPKFYPSY